MLTVLEEGQRAPGGQRTVVCGCDCGNTTTVLLQSIRTGNTKSCGHLGKESRAASSTRHGMYKAPEYAVWRAMKNRCYLLSNNHYADYGGRGITVCERWRLSFSDFIADVGRRPSPDLTLDRKDNNGNYEPGNVRWTTRAMQQRNKRDNKRMEVDGVPLIARDIADKTGLSVGCIKYRSRMGATGAKLTISSDRNGNRNMFLKRGPGDVAL